MGEQAIVNVMEAKRVELGLSAKDFAVTVGMWPSHYCEFVKLRRRLPLGARKRAFKLGVDAGVLLGD